MCALLEKLGERPSLAKWPKSNDSLSQICRQCRTRKHCWKPCSVGQGSGHGLCTVLDSYSSVTYPFQASVSICKMKKKRSYYIMGLLMTLNKLSTLHSSWHIVSVHSMLAVVLCCNRYGCYCSTSGCFEIWMVWYSTNLSYADNSVAN